MDVWVVKKAYGSLVPGQGWSHPVSRMKVERSATSGRGVNPCERYHRNGTGGVVTCACRPASSNHSGLLPGTRYAHKRENLPRYNPAQGPPKKRGRSSLSLGPSGEGPRPDVGWRSLRLRRHARLSFSSCVCLRVCVHLCVHDVGVRTRTPDDPMSLHAHGYCVSFVGIFGDRARLVSPRPSPPLRSFNLGKPVLSWRRATNAWLPRGRR